VTRYEAYLSPLAIRLVRWHALPVLPRVQCWVPLSKRCHALEALCALDDASRRGHTPLRM